MADKTSKRINGATPNGGSYAIAYFRDKDGQPCSESKAVRIEIVEYTDKGDEICRTYGSTSNGAGKHG